MRRFLFSALLLLLQGLGAAQANDGATEPVDLVNPMINTAACRYDFFASASTPMGMVSLQPDTRHGDLWQHGYLWGDSCILNFSHIHNTQNAGIPVMPAVGPCKGHLGLAAGKSRFSHDKEVARPGYHKVFLEDSGITAELTATCRVGMHRYTFPAAQEAHLVFDLSATLGPTKMEYAYVRRVSPTEIEGYSVQAPTYRRKKRTVVYFVAQVNRPMDAFGGWVTPPGAKSGTRVEPQNGVIRGKGSGAFLTFRPTGEGETLLLKVGLSFVSTDNARMNLQAEAPHWDFDRVVAEARSAWNAYLGRFSVEGGTPAQQTKFYTDLYHTAIGRRIVSDVDGSYTDCTGPLPVVRRMPQKDGRPDHPFIDGDGLWGTQWNLNILWALVYPEYGNWIAKTFLDYWYNAGTMARTSWGGDYAYVMVGDQNTPLLAALHATGRARFDAEAAYAAMRKNAFPGGIRDRAGYEAGDNPQGGGIDLYVEKGYVPVEIRERGDGFHRGGTAMTLEYAYQDWCIAQMARSLGKTDDAALFEKRAENWRNVFDAQTCWARPRLASGAWMEPFAPVSDNGQFPPGFIEGNSAIYTWYVPQNMEGLIEAMGGCQAFADRLESSFRKAEPYNFFTPHGKHGMGWVDYENQPSCCMAHLFSHAGMPWKTQYWVRRVKDQTYGGTDPYSGYNGDEDQGQMGALGVLMAVGLFDVRGCVGEHPTLEITTPVFDRVTIQVPVSDRPDQTRTFEIVARRKSGNDLYIQSARLNGRPWNSFRFPVSDFLQGGRLELILGPKPNKKWGLAR